MLGQETRGQRRNRFVAAALAGVLGSSTLFIAYPHTRAELSQIRTDALITLSGQGLRPDELMALRRELLRQTRWVSSGEPWYDLARLYTRGVIQDDAEAGAEDDAASSQAEQALHRSVALSPMNPYAWYRLARIYKRQEDWARAGQALELSVKTGRTGEWLTLARCRLALQMWPHLGEYARNIYRREFAIALHRDPDGLLRVARDAGRIDVLRQSLPRELRTHKYLADPETSPPGSGAVPSG